MAGTHQSRVFNFIGSHTNRVRDSLAQSWRQVKISVQWTGQILLAPLRWLQRFSQNPDRQMAGGRDRSTLPMGNESHADPPPASSSQTPAETTKLTAVSANQAIEHLLAEVVAAGHGLLSTSALARSTYEDWSVIDDQDWDTTLLDESNLALAGTSAAITPSRPVIQGLATLLSNGNLVLIDQHNQVLDVLSPSQQLHLRQQINPGSARALNSAVPRLPEPSAPTLSGMATTASLPAKDSAVTFQQVVLPPSPEVPETLWQKINYWGKFYLEYLRVDVGDATSSSQPLLPALKLPFPFQKSLAITPKSIAPLAPLTNGTTGELAKTSVNHNSLVTNDDEARINPNLTINVTSQRQPIKAPAPTKKQAKSQVTFQPQWIEAPTENLGYERSLWQQVLAWLDRMMLAIENWLIALYHRLKGES